MENIQAMRLFVRVVDLGSFSKAAAELGMGQPAATKQVRRMETQLGARLLHRSTRGVTPTEIGLLYCEKCKLILHHVDEAASVAALLQTQVQGALRISTSVAFGRRVMAPLVMQFMRLNPGLQVDLSCDDRYVDLVEQGVDVAIRMGRLADSTLGSRHLGLNPWVVVASHDYLRQHGTPRTPDELTRHRLLIYNLANHPNELRLTRDGVETALPVHGVLEATADFLAEGETDDADIDFARRALVSEPLSAALAREHNDANVLAMGARLTGIDMAKACNLGLELEAAACKGAIRAFAALHLALELLIELAADGDEVTADEIASGGFARHAGEGVRVGLHARSSAVQRGPVS